MDIWEILDTEPTTDKKAIKRAYAARTKVIHPEEKPEEFRILHAAYQAALKYAEFASKRAGDFANNFKGESVENGEDFINDSDESSTVGVSPEQENAGHAELISFFTENQEKQQQRIDAFAEYWKELKNISDDPKGYEWWQEYLASEDFQHIRWNIQILHLLIEEIDDKFFYGTNEVKMLFWNAYGFKANDVDRYQGEQQKLWQCLYPAYEYYEKVFLAKEWDRKSKRSFRIFLAGVFVCVLIIGVIVFVFNNNKKENERQLIEAYMAERYPRTEFSVPERSRQEQTSGVAYNFYSSDHPDLLITARIKYPYPSSERIAMVTEEDYGLQLLEYYAAQYGLLCGRMEYAEDGDNSREKKIYSVLFYSDIGQIDAFCETVTKMFGEQEDLQTVPSVGICAGNILFPEVFLQGGVNDFPFDDPQIYDLSAMEEKELTAQLKEAYMIYMFQYESWNLTLQQCREWGAAYEEVCRQWQDYRGIWYDMTDLHTGDVLCTIYISTYMHTDYRHSLPSYEESVTVGNAYNLLLIQGADVTVNEDGSGFSAELNGQTETFGTEPTIRLSKLRLMPIATQNNLHVLE